MPEVKKEPIISGENVSPRPDSGDDDPLLHLHRMSTTAGVGSQDYVAVNGPAVASVLLGAIGVLAVFENVLLVVPLTGIVFALVSLRQIGQSNGTQTGKKLALIGLVLGLGVMIYVSVVGVRQELQARADGAAIDAACVRLGEDLKQGKIDDAYGLFTDGFKGRYSHDDFAAVIQSQNNWWIVRLDGLKWNGEARFNSDSDTGVTTAQVGVKMLLTDFPEDRLDASLRKTAGGWRFDNIPRIFPARKAPANTQGPGQ